MIQVAAILVPFATAVAVAIIAKLQFSKHVGDRPNTIAPNATVYSLLAQQDGQIAELSAKVVAIEKAVLQCQEREKALLDRLGLEVDD